MIIRRLTKELFQMNCLNFLNLTDNIALNDFHTSVPQSLKKVVSIKRRKYIRSNHNPFANKNIHWTSLRNRSLKDHAPISRVSYPKLKPLYFIRDCHQISLLMLSEFNPLMPGGNKKVTHT